MLEPEPPEEVSSTPLANFSEISLGTMATLQYDEEGFLNLSLPEDFDWIVDAAFCDDDRGKCIIRITLRDGYQSDLDEQFARNADEAIKKLEGVTKVYQEDREYFHITFEEGQSLPELLKRIEQLFRSHAQT